MKTHEALQLSIVCYIFAIVVPTKWLSGFAVIVGFFYGLEALRTTWEKFRRRNRHRKKK